MKKLLYLILFITIGVLCSCSSNHDADEPQHTTSVIISLENVGIANGNIYVVKNTNFDVASIAIASRTADAEKIEQVEYYIDSRLKIRNVFTPFEASFETGMLSEGRHQMKLSMETQEEGAKGDVLSADMNIVVVDSEAELPQGVTLGNAVMTLSFN